MKWVREYGWLAVLVLGVVYFVWLRPPRGPKPGEVQAGIEKQRAEFRDRQAKLEADLARIRTDAILRMLGLVGKAYRGHLAREKQPPTAADFVELVPVWTSDRDDQPFEIVWGVDLNKLPNGGTGHRLAWEKVGAADGTRCVLLADGRTAKVMTATEFAGLPAGGPAER